MKKSFLQNVSLTFDCRWTRREKTFCVYQKETAVNFCFHAARKHFFLRRSFSRRTCILFLVFRFIRTFVFEFNASIYIKATHTNDCGNIGSLYRYMSMNKCRPRLHSIFIDLSCFSQHSELLYSVKIKSVSDDFFLVCF